MRTTIGLGAIIFTIFSIVTAWVTHVVWWISLVMVGELDTAGEAVLAILGTLCFPIGVVHGFLLWFS